MTYCDSTEMTGSPGAFPLKCVIRVAYSAYIGTFIGPVARYNACGITLLLKIFPPGSRCTALLVVGRPNLVTHACLNIRYRAIEL